MKRTARKMRMVTLWCILSLYCLSILFAFFVVSEGRWIDNFFFYDIRDTGEDFFHSIEYVTSRAPYEDFQTLYPPLANLFFSVICKCMPNDLREEWPTNSKALFGVRGTDLDLRTHQAPFVAFLVFLMVSVTTFVYIFEMWAVGERRSVARLASFCAVFSYGSLYAIERGNIILLAFLLCAFFLLKRRDKNKLVKEGALIGLAVAAGFKLYPAAFGLLLLTDRDYKGAARTILYGIVCLFVPFLFYHEGFGGIKIWLDVLRSFTASSPEWWNNSVASILYHASSVLDNRFGVTISDAHFQQIGYAAALLFCLSAFFLDKEWERILAVVLAVLSYSTQADYIYIMALLPLFALFWEEKYLKRNNIFPFFCLSLMTLPLPLLYRKESFYPHNTIMQLAFIGLTIFVAVRLVREAGARRKMRRTAAMAQ